MPLPSLELQPLSTNDVINKEMIKEKAKCVYTSEKNVKGYVEMAVPKTTASRCRDGSTQARHDIQRLHK